MRRRRSGGSKDARDAANAGHREHHSLPTSLRGGDVRLFGVITSCVGNIVSGILASGVLVVGSVIRSSLALGAESVIGHHTIRVFVIDCRAIKKPRQITSAKNLWWALPGLNR